MCIAMPSHAGSAEKCKIADHRCDSTVIVPKEPGRRRKVSFLQTVWLVNSLNKERPVLGAFKDRSISGALRRIIRPFLASPVATASLSSYYGVIQSVLCQSFVTINSRVPQRGILVATEREHGLIHLLSVEDL